jgi:hypothetical protein
MDTNTQPLDTVVLAGSINQIPLFDGGKPGRKALVELRGRPIIAYTLDALRAARGVGRILVVGSPEVIRYARQWADVVGVPEGKTLIENARRGLAAGRTPWLLFCNPDQPLLKPEMVEDFLSRALPATKDADAVVAWVRDDAIGQFEEARHKFAEFGDGCFTHGNLFLIRQDLPDNPRLSRRLDSLYRARKNVLRFAWAMGPALFLRFVWARITRKFPSLQEVHERTSRCFGIRIAGVLSPYVRIAMDIDEPVDYAAAEKYLALEAGAGSSLLKAA